MSVTGFILAVTQSVSKVIPMPLASASFHICCISLNGKIQWKYLLPAQFFELNILFQLSSDWLGSEKWWWSFFMCSCHKSGVWFSSVVSILRQISVAQQPVEGMDHCGDWCLLAQKHKQTWALHFLKLLLILTCCMPPEPICPVLPAWHVAVHITISLSAKCNNALCCGVTIFDSWVMSLLNEACYSSITLVMERIHLAQMFFFLSPELTQHNFKVS